MATDNQSPAAEPPWKVALSRAAVNVKLGTLLVYNFIVDIILGRRSVSLLHYAAYTLRIGGLTIVGLGFFAPLMTSGISGMVGWMVDLLIALLVGFAMFVVAELVLLVQAMAAKLERLSRAEVSQKREIETEGF